RDTETAAAATPPPPTTPEDNWPALRRRCRDDATAPVGGDRADIVVQCLLHRGRCFDNRGRLAPPMKADQRRRILFRPAILAAEDTRITHADGEMADRELMQRGREAMLFEQIAGRHIDIDERRLHVGEIE